jgi:hypothetical protein
VRIVLAALDAGPAARPVLETAFGLAELADAAVEAVHVRSGPVDTLATLASRHSIPLRILERPVEPALLDALTAPDVVAAAFGARATPAGRRPVGRTAFHILERLRKPVVVVPPDLVGVAPRRFVRLLVPLEGSEQTSRPVAESLSPLVCHPVELVVLHVFTAATMPRTLDRPERDLSLWGDEFLARFCPEASQIELRSGSIGSRVAEVGDEKAVDLVVLSWSQDSSPGHAAVIRDVLGHSTIPVLLLPVDLPAHDGAEKGALAPVD